jgi:hypothetical protein
MKSVGPVLEGLRVASPCTVPWDGMAGNDRVRHCGECRLNVYNLSEMTRREAEALVRGAEGRLCVRFFRRPDGTVLTRDCPVGLRAVRMRLVRLGSAVAALFLGMLAGGCRKAVDGGDPIPPTPPVGTPPEAMGRIAVSQPLQGDVAEPRHVQGEVVAPPEKAK